MPPAEPREMPVSARRTSSSEAGSHRHDSGTLGSAVSSAGPWGWSSSSFLMVSSVSGATAAQSRVAAARARNPLRPRKSARSRTLVGISEGGTSDAMSCLSMGNAALLETGLVRLALSLADCRREVSSQSSSRAPLRNSSQAARIPAAGRLARQSFENSKTYSKPQKDARSNADAAAIRHDGSMMSQTGILALRTSGIWNVNDGGP